jgi:hypothetical protein
LFEYMSCFPPKGLGELICGNGLIRGLKLIKEALKCICRVCESLFVLCGYLIDGL